MTQTLVVPQDARHIVAAGVNEVSLITRPPLLNSGIIKTVRGEVGQHTSFVGEPKPLSGNMDVALIADVGNWRFKIGDWTDKPFATTDVTVADDSITEVGHNLATGMGPFRASSGTTLPAGLAAVTNYWIIKVDDDTYKLAATKQDAYDGVAVTITDQGTGTHTLEGTWAAADVPTANAPDGEAWVRLPAGQSIVVPDSEFITVFAPLAADVLTYFYSPGVR